MIERLRALSAIEAAPLLLGWELVRTLPEGIIRGRITETEAYHQSDPASHTYKGETARTKSMFGPGGHAYVYFTYGMHFCLNVVAGPAGSGEGVLLRSLEILEGADLALRNRNGRTPLALGPARLTQALRVDRSLDGHDLASLPLQLREGSMPSGAHVQVTPRIGISQAVEAPLRFVLREGPLVQ